MRRCPQCGVETPDQAKFCGNCGYIVPPLPPEQQYAPRPANIPSDNAPFVPADAKQMRMAPYPQALQAPPQSYIPYGVVPPIPVIPPAKKKQFPFILAGIAFVFVLIVVAAGLLLWRPTAISGAPQLTMLSGQPAPGQSITLQGSHFPAGYRLGVVVDANPLILFAPPKNLAMISTSLFPLSLMKEQGAIYSITVGNDGTFTIKVKIPTSWKAGSLHVIVAQVLGANPQKLKPVQYQFTVA